MSDRPDLRDLLPDDVGPDELARLERVHRLLLQSEAPPELSGALAEGPAGGAATDARILPFARRTRRLLVAAATVAAAALFGFGFLSGSLVGDDGFEATYGPVAMVGSGPTRAAGARIWVGKRDAARNWPSRMEVEGLPPLDKGEHYTLYLTDRATGERLLLCSAFTVHDGTTTVTFNFPGPFRDKGWVIVAEKNGEPGDGKAVPVLWTTDDAAGAA
jgi:hypothetical protein